MRNPETSQHSITPSDLNGLRGKPGDYLACGADGELYVIDRDIFAKTYEEVPG